MGLFTGISILSIMEVVFWILRYFIRNTVTRKNKVKKTQSF